MTANLTFLSGTLQHLSSKPIFLPNLHEFKLLNFVPKIKNASAKSSLVPSEPHLLACHFTLASTREKPVQRSVLLSFGQKIGLKHWQETSQHAIKSARKIRLHERC